MSATCAERDFFIIIIIILDESFDEARGESVSSWLWGYSDLGRRFSFKLEIKFSWIFSSFVNLFKDTLFLRWLIFNKELIFFSL